MTFFYKYHRLVQNPIHKVFPLFSNCKSSLIIKLPASLSNVSIFGITFLSIPAAVALAVKLDAKVFVADITGHLCTLINC